MRKIHEIKVSSDYFYSIVSGDKKATVRVNDRDYKVGELLLKNEVDKNDRFTGNSILLEITHILKDEKFLPSPLVMMSFDVLIVDKDKKIMEGAWL